MKTLFIFLRLSLVILITGTAIYLYYPNQSTSSPIVPSEAEAESEEANAIPGAWLFHQRAFPHDRINKAAVLEARRARKRIIEDKLQSAGQRLDDEWEFSGATNIGGRVTDIEMPKSSQETIYVGTASGGIFQTNDLGDTWEPIFDDALSLAIGDIAIAPSDDNIMYVGTGEPNGGGGSITYDGFGVYKTTDAGKNWTSVGLETVGSIGKIIVDPNDPDRLWVAAMGDLFGATDDRGVYRSTDGGQNWTKVLFISQKAGAIDLVLDPTDPDRIYAATWERTRTPENNTYGGADSGIYRSTNGGTDWTELTNGLPTFAEQKGRIGLTISASQPNILYAFYATTDGWTQGVYRTDDAGDSWQNMNAIGINSVPFMWWFGKIFVHPENPSQIYLSGFNTERSVDNGASWSTVFNDAHVDQHTVFIHPANPDLVVIGNDGGVYLSFDGGLNHAKLNNLPITQFYTCEIDFLQPEALYGGTQDNGCQRTPDGQLDNWEVLFWGDGFVNLVNPLDNNILYAESQRGNLVRSNDGGQFYSSVLFGIDPGDRNNWNTPVVFDPNDPSIMYYGTQRLYRSTNGADSWEAISEDLSDGPGSGSQTFGTITSISVSPLDPNIIYVGTDDGNISWTTNLGEQWENISDDLPVRWVTSVAADPADIKVAYATFSGYRYYSNEPHVFKTSDNGINWEDISGNLPDVPVNKILILEPGRLVIATDIGVFISEDDGASWEMLGAELPNVVVTDLDYHDPTSTLVAATYGRSMYQYTFSPTVATNELTEVAFQAKIFPNPSRGVAQLQWEAPTTDTYTVDLLDASGRVLRRLSTARWSVGPQQITLSADDLATGLYRVQLQNSRGQQALEWLIVE